MILKLDNRAAALTEQARTGSVPCWEYVGGVKAIRCGGWVTRTDEPGEPSWSLDWLNDVAVEVRGPIAQRSGEVAGGFVHEVEWLDATRPVAFYWLNVPDAYLLNDSGDTIDRLATGGGTIGTVGPLGDVNLYLDPTTGRTVRVPTGAGA